MKYVCYNIYKGNIVKRKGLKMKSSQIKMLKALSSYYNQKKKIDEMSKELNSKKTKIFKNLEKYYKENNYGVGEKIYFNLGDETLSVKRSQRIKIKFDIKKLKKVLGKKLSNDVIDTQYTLIDSKGLFMYLKELNADPEIVKGFLTKEEKVNEERLEELENLGKIEANSIKDCCTFEKGNLSFLIDLKSNE